MLRVYCGNDAVSVREKAFTYIATLEREGYEVARIEAETYVPGVIADALGATSLFGSKTVYVLDTPSALAEFNAAVTDQLAELAASENQFVLIEGALLAPVKKKLQQHAESFEEIKAASVSRFNTFALADALANKDKKTLWLLLHEAQHASVSAEEIIGVLWWQLKALRLAGSTTNASEAGMKDFPYNKAKRSLKNFSEGEIDTRSHSLLDLYHQGHAGQVDIDLALEQWVLQL